MAIIDQTIDAFEHLMVSVDDGDAQAAWRSVNLHFMPRDQQQISDLQSTFFRMTMESTRLGLCEFGAAVRRQAKTLKDAHGSPLIHESQEISIYLRGLLPSYVAIVGLIMEKKLSDLKMPAVMQRVHKYAINTKIIQDDVSQATSINVLGLHSAPICNNFQNDTCRFGDKCRYRHVKETNSTSTAPNASSGRDNPRPFTGECNHCGIKGHKKADCRKLKREQKEAEETTYVEVDEHYDNVFMLQDHANTPKQDKNTSIGLSFGTQSINLGVPNRCPLFYLQV